MVDDEPGVREAVERALRLDGYDVVLAADGGAPSREPEVRSANRIAHVVSSNPDRYVFGAAHTPITHGARAPPTTD